jgi:hypothetical protein
MAEHIWSVLCEGSSVDKLSNQVSLFSAVENINFLFGPEVPPSTAEISITVQMRLVSYWIRSRISVAEKAEARVSLELPNGRVVIEKGGVAIDLTTAPRARTLNQIGSIRYAGPGYYAFIVEYRRLPTGRWKRAARVPFEVGVVTAAALPGEKIPDAAQK